MGQYFIIVNLEKREYIHPHDLKRGAKLLELSKDPIIYSLMSYLQVQNETPARAEFQGIRPLKG